MLVLMRALSLDVVVDLVKQQSVYWDCWVFIQLCEMFSHSLHKLRDVLLVVRHFGKASVIDSSQRIMNKKIWARQSLP